MITAMKIENKIKINRREALQKVGSLGALVGTPITVGTTTAEQNPEEGLRTGKFQFLTTDVSVPKPEDAPISTGCNRYPHFMKSSTGTYLPAIEIGDDSHSHIISSLNGVDQFSNQFGMDYSMVPYDGAATGTYRAVSGNIDLNPLFTITEEGVQVDVTGEQTVVPAGESFNTEVQADIEYETWNHDRRSETVDTKFSVTNHGFQNLFWHTDKVLIPKESEAGSHIKNMVEKLRLTTDAEIGSGDAVVIEAKSGDSPKHVISDIPSANAYAITGKHQNDEQHATSESATEVKRREN